MSDHLSLQPSQPAPTPRWRRVAVPVLLILGTLLLLGGLFMTSFWWLAGSIVDSSQTGLTEEQFASARTLMILWSLMGLVAPGIIMIVVGLRLRRR